MKPSELPIYERAVARYPHLANLQNAKVFCDILCRLAMVPGISMLEYRKIAEVASGRKWED